MLKGSLEGKKKGEFVLTPKAKTAFKELKDAFTSAFTLRH